MAPCGVCGDARGVTKCYGGQVCGSCRIFFLRAVVNNEKYVCARERNCVIVCAQPTIPTPIVAMHQALQDAPEFRTSLHRLNDTSQNHLDTLRLPICPAYPSFADNRPPMLPILNLNLNRTTDFLGNTYAIGLSFVELLKSELGSARAYANALLALEHMSFGQTGWITPKPNPIIDETMERDSIVDVTNPPPNLPILPPFNLRPSSSKTREISVADLPSTSREVGLSFLNPEISLRMALTDPQQICERIPMNWQQIQEAPNLDDSFRFLYCRQTVHYIDWLNALGGIQDLSQRDKLLLISGGLSHVQILMMYYQTYCQDSRGIAYSLGYHYAVRGPGGTELENFLDALAIHGHELVISEFRRLDIKPEEYILLKALVLYASVHELSDEGKEIVRKARQQHEQTLIQFVKEEYPLLTEEQRTLRVHSIMSIKNSLRTIGLMDNRFIGRMVALNIGRMRCQIAYDVHLKEF
ncbi:unnamed protein product, partial [Mesorhabditis spiculigera]